MKIQFDAMRSAVDAAESVMRKNADPKKTREQYRDLIASLCAAQEALAYELDGDGAYISDEYLGLTSRNGSVDSVFLDLIDGVEKLSRFERSQSRGDAARDEHKHAEASL